MKGRLFEAKRHVSALVYYLLLCAADEATARPAPREALGPKALDAAGRVLQQLRTLKQTPRE